MIKMKLVENLVIFSSTVLLICASQVFNDSENKTSNQDDSWLYYTMQTFNQTREENMAPSETLLFHGYIPPVNHLEDYPQIVARKNLSYLQTPTSLPPAKDSTDNESHPDSIQDLLEPAEADQSSTTEQDTDLSEENDPDDDDDGGNQNSARPELEYQPPDMEPMSGSEEDSFEKRSDEDDDEPDSDQYDQDDDEDRTLNSDSNRSNREDDSDEDEDGIEQEDFGDGGETKKIDDEISIPHGFIWRPESDEATGQENNDFDFDDTQFDKEYSQETRIAQPLILSDQNDTTPELHNNSFANHTSIG